MFGADAKGWCQICCDTADFHFTKFSPNPASQELRLRLETGNLRLVPAPGLWWGHVKGQLCARDGKCEEAVKADIQVEKMTSRRVWGKYVVDFENQHFEGDFSARFHTHVPVCICE
jgi:hypothetical protein